MSHRHKFTTAQNQGHLRSRDLTVSSVGSETKICCDRKTARILKQNPFSTKFTSPGTIPFFFPTHFQSSIKNNDPKFEHYFFRSLVDSDHLWTNICLLFLADQLEKKGGVVQIVGPHGSGKSTLTVALKEVLLKKGYHLLFQTLHDKQRRLPQEFWTDFAQFRTTDSMPKLVIIDGYEQLSFFQRFRLRYWCRAHKTGLLITTHRPFSRIPILYQTETHRETLDQIIDYLLEIPMPFVDQKVMTSLMQKHRSNTRDILFSLYDLYEETFA